jgi:DNA-binding NtrC family response regulator
MSQNRLLIIDDEAGVRETLCEVLRDEGYEVDTAPDGVTGIELFRKEHWDVALVDLKMPGMDGLQVMEKMHTIRPSMPVVIITGYGTVENAVEAMKLGAADYLMKPFTPAEIRS